MEFGLVLSLFQIKFTQKFFALIKEGMFK